MIMIYCMYMWQKTGMVKLENMLIEKSCLGERKAYGSDD